MCFILLPYFTVGSNFTIEELNLRTLESHMDFNPFTFWLRYTCTKRTVPSLLTTDYTSMNFSLSSQGDLNVERLSSSESPPGLHFTIPAAVRIRDLVFPSPHQLLFPPVIISVAITTHYSSDQPRLWTTRNKTRQQHQQRFESQAAVIISGSH